MAVLTRVLSVMCVGCFCSAVTLQAQGGGNKAQSILVHVRSLDASDSLEQKKNTLRHGPVRYEIDERISDLSEQLKRLHFRKFKLRNSVEKRMALESKVIFELGDGHTLELKPLYRNKDRVCLWIEWTDGSGMKVLNTRLHLNVKESMITGTDQSQDSGVILAIDVADEQ